MSNWPIGHGKLRELARLVRAQLPEPCGVVLVLVPGEEGAEIEGIDNLTLDGMRLVVTHLADEHNARACQRYAKPKAEA